MTDYRIFQRQVGQPTPTGAVMHTLSGPRRRPEREATPEQCVKHGGHCWHRDPAYLASYPPVYSETCKHCPATRTGRSREPVEWTYPEGQP